MEIQLSKVTPEFAVTTTGIGRVTGLAGTPEHIKKLMEELPASHEPFTDKYFQRTGEILRHEGLNPWVKAQVVIRKGPGIVEGIDEAIAILLKYSKIAEHGGTIRALKDGFKYDSGEAIMTIEAPINDIVELETMYLGVISAATTRATEKDAEIDLESVTRRMHAVVTAAEGRPVIYMGARHWDFREDQAISSAALLGGATDCSTDIGAAVVGKKAVGTIPHVLENIYAAVAGKRNAVVEATKAFARVIDPAVNVVALIDYDNHEIDDSLATAHALGNRLYGIRVDTCGENRAQGALPSADCEQAIAARAAGVPLVDASDPDARYWYGNGVTITGVYALRKALDSAGFANVKIVLSSGFGDVKKVRAFVRAEKLLGISLFDYLGVGGVYDSRHAKTDIVAVGKKRHTMVPISKAGRAEVYTSRLQAVDLAEVLAC